MNPKSRVKTSTRLQNPHQRFADEMSHRIIEQLDARHIQIDQRRQFLAQKTGRAQQTTRRWIDPAHPGLPDLESFSELCKAFETDADWMLGLSLHPQSPSSDSPLHALYQALNALSAEYEVREISHRELEPLLKLGDFVFVDKKVTAFQESGIYLLQYENLEIFRQIELQVGRGLIIHTPLQTPSEMVLTPEQAASVTILGRVVKKVSLNFV